MTLGTERTNVRRNNRHQYINELSAYEVSIYLILQIGLLSIFEMLECVYSYKILVKFGLFVF